MALSRLRLALLAAPATFLLAPAAGLAQCFPGQCVWDACHTPAHGAPSSLWGDLEPTDGSLGRLPARRDTTWFDQGTGWNCQTSLFEALDVENGWVFVAANWGLQIWDATTPTRADQPIRLSYACANIPSQSPLPVFPEGLEENRYAYYDVDAPPGVDTVVATGHNARSGVAIWDTSNKSLPHVVYQDFSDDTAKFAGEVYATTVGGRHIAFAAIQLNYGLQYYDMSRAAQLAGPCLEDAPDHLNPACSGVFLGRLGSRLQARHVDGHSDPAAGEHFVAFSGSTFERGVEIWDVSDLQNPVRKLSNTTEVFKGLALWKDSSDGDYYLAVHGLFDSRIYRDAGDCLTSPGTCGLGSWSLVWSDAISSSDLRAYVTYSESGGSSYLYFGSAPNCALLSAREYLFEVNDPAHPRELGGEDYWGFYYRAEETPLAGGKSAGFNTVAPRKGKVHGDYFYRAGFSIFDVHEVRTAVPSITVSGPTTGYAGQPLAFTASANHCTPSPSWNWSASGGGVVSGTGAAVSIQWATPGTETVTATNAGCPGLEGQAVVTLDDPDPAVTGISVDPPSPLVCQSVALGALGVTGQPPITYTWEVRDSGANTVASGSGTNLQTFTWQTGAATDPGTYTAEVTVTNAGDPTGETALRAFSLATPPSLGIPSGPSLVGPDPPTGATVELAAETTGAASWTWDYGDGTGETFTEQPAGENPAHTYTAVGTYGVTLTVDNCLESAVTGTPLSVEITQINPLGIEQFEAVCPFGICAFSTGESIAFNQAVTGTPERFSYDWDGNGGFEQCSATQVNHHTYTAAGSYTPVMRVHRGANSACQGGESETRVHDLGTITVIETGGGSGRVTITGPTTGVVGEALTYTAGSSGCSTAPSSWTWSFEGGDGEAVGDTLEVSYGEPGAYNVRVEANNGDCAFDAATRGVTVSSGTGGELGAAFTVSPAEPSAGHAVTFDATASTGDIAAYAWNFGDGTTGSGSVVEHTFGSPGSYEVTLSIAETGCGTAPACFAEAAETVVVSGEATLEVAFTLDVACTGSGSTEVCPVEAGREIAFTDSSVATGNPIDSRSWSFGDGTAAEGAAVSHAYTEPGSYTVTLTVTAGALEGQASRRMVVSAAPQEEDRVVLPWVVQGQAALDQVTSLYVHNPDTEPMRAVLRFFRRPGPSTEDPPPVETTLGAGATAYFADVLHDAFGLDNAAGFLVVDNAAETGPAPVARAFHRTLQLDGSSFGQAVPGVGATGFPKSSRPESEVLHLVGLFDDGERLGFFGITNPTPEPARFQLRFRNALGEPIGEEPEPLSVAAFGQRQFQVSTIRELFGVAEEADYRVDIEVLSGGPLYPYGANLRLGTEDPAFLRGGDPTLEKVFLVGALATRGLEGTLWKTDLVLSHVGDEAAETEVRFVGVGNGSEPEEPQRLTLLPGETLRLEDVLVSRFGLDAESSLGLLTVVHGDGVPGSFPLVQGESYDAADPERLFGQLLPPLAERDAAQAGQRHVLAGLQQDEASRSTLWLVNPAETGRTEVDLVYRALDGSVLGRLDGIRIAAGRLRQINPSAHPLPAEGVLGGFTVQAVVRQGRLLTAAQVVNSRTDDPAFVAGVTR